MGDRAIGIETSGQGCAYESASASLRGHDKAVPSDGGAPTMNLYAALVRDAAVPAPEHDDDRLPAHDRHWSKATLPQPK